MHGDGSPGSRDPLVSVGAGARPSRGNTRGVNHNAWIWSDLDVVGVLLIIALLLFILQRSLTQDARGGPGV